MHFKNTKINVTKKKDLKHGQWTAHNDSDNDDDDEDHDDEDHDDEDHDDDKDDSGDGENQETMN